MSEVDEKAHYLAGIRRSRIMAAVFVSIALVLGYVGLKINTGAWQWTSQLVPGLNTL